MRLQVRFFFVQLDVLFITVVLTKTGWSDNTDVLSINLVISRIPETAAEFVYKVVLQVGGPRKWVSMELIKIDSAPKRQTALEYKAALANCSKQGRTIGEDEA